MNGLLGIWFLLHVAGLLLLFFVLWRPDKQTVKMIKKSHRISVKSRRAGSSRRQAIRDGRLGTAGNQIRMKLSGCFLLVVLGVGFKLLILVEALAFSWFASLFGY
jgi:hypothetical protein